MISLFSIQDPGNSIEWMLYLADKYAGMFWEGTKLTLFIAVLGTILGFALGYVIGIIQDAKINKGDHILKKALLRLIKAIVTVYVEIFRDTPMIVQAMIIYFGIREANIEIDPVSAGVLVTVLNTGAYMAETVRAGIGSIDLGQREGAWAMGMSPMKTMICVVLPRRLKYYSRDGQYLSDQPENDIGAECDRGCRSFSWQRKRWGGNYYKYFESYLVIAVIYFVLCFAFNKIFNFMEKKMRGRSDYALAVEYMDNQ